MEWWGRTGESTMSVPGPTVIEFFHSKPFSPTRRLCLGEVRLPADAGCLLVSRIAARFGAAVDRATAEEVRDLWAVLCRQSRADQPRGRYRLQTDRVGLARARDSLVSVGGRPRLVVVDRDVAPVTHLLAALYAAAGRRRLLDGFLEGFENPEPCNGFNASLGYRWPDTRTEALELFGLGGNGAPAPEVRRRYRELLRKVHPDNGGDPEVAASRISDLQRALSVILAGRD